MQNAQCLREQADRCLKIVRYISDQKAADGLRSLAAEYHERATEIDAAHEKGNRDRLT